MINIPSKCYMAGASESLKSTNPGITERCSQVASYAESVLSLAKSISSRVTRPQPEPPDQPCPPDDHGHIQSSLACVERDLREAGEILNGVLSLL
jgi:hypothetical protein